MVKIYQIWRTFSFLLFRKRFSIIRISISITLRRSIVIFFQNLINIWCIILCINRSFLNLFKIVILSPSQVLFFKVRLSFLCIAVLKRGINFLLLFFSRTNFQRIDKDSNCKILICKHFIKCYLEAISWVWECSLEVMNKVLKIEV